MDIVVCIKQIYDLAQIKVDASKRPVSESAARKISDFDKNALEEAVRLRERHGGNVLALIKGNKEGAKEALAIGADEAFIYDADFDSLGTASLLAKIIKNMKYDIILCGEASIDEYSFQTGARVAEALGIPLITYARKIEIKNNEVFVEKVLENRYEVARAVLPALVTVTKEINEPRIPTLLQILGASKKKITEITPEKQERGVETLSIQAVEMKRKEVILKDVEELAKVIISELGAK